jgi:DNA-directed RNA polymerase specialized sigma24 family protein
MSPAAPDSSELSAIWACSPLACAAEVGSSRHAAPRTVRVRAIVAKHYAFLWRSLRRLGVPEVDVEDAPQKCLWVVARRIDDIAHGKERTFLFGVVSPCWDLR